MKNLQAIFHIANDAHKLSSTVFFLSISRRLIYIQIQMRVFLLTAVVLLLFLDAALQTFFV